MHRPDESEWIINNFRFYGHLHPGMSTSPSPKDNEQFNSIVKDTKDYFIRCICNKDGRMEMSVIFFAQKVKISDVAWELHIPIEEERKQKWQQEIKKKVQPYRNSGYYQPQQYQSPTYQPPHESSPRYAGRIPGYQDSFNATIPTTKTSAKKQPKPTAKASRNKKQMLHTKSMIESENREDDISLANAMREESEKEGGKKRSRN